jgi:hypothetical protein
MTFLYHCFLTSAALSCLGFLIVVGAGEDAKRATLTTAGTMIAAGVGGIIVSGFAGIWQL